MAEYSILANRISKVFKLNSWNIYHTKTKLDIIKAIDNISLSIEKGKPTAVVQIVDEQNKVRFVNKFSASVPSR